MTELEKSKNNRLQSQIQTLRSGNRSAIITTLHDLRSTGSVPILRELFDLILDQEDEQITDEISSLLNDLKDKEAAPLLVEAIASPVYSKIQSILVAACWQSGLSFGNYVDTFVEVAITGEYDAAIEAFTVIEEAIGDIEEPERKKLTSIIDSRMEEVSERKKPLLRELVKVISGY